MFQFLAKLKKKRFERNLQKQIAKANALSKADKYKYMVLVAKGRLIIARKQTLKRKIEQGYFQKGVTIQSLEEKALYITT